MQRNPYLLQKGPPSSVPLFLVHDGGGTTFAYHSLGSLGRTVYAIHNPRFYAGRSWPGGVSQMAKIYAHLITSAVPSGRILLGGWSFGGLISLEIAKILENSPIQVIGVVMLDTLCPRALKHSTLTISPLDPPFSKRCKPEIRLLVLNMMRLSTKMTEQWEFPVSWSRSPRGRPWHRVDSAVDLTLDGSDSASQDGYTPALLESSDFGSITATSASSSPRELSPSSSDLEGEQKTDSSSMTLPQAWPRVILLRSEEYVPLSLDVEPGTVARVDALRDRPLLGWETCNEDLISTVIKIPGNHFNIFDDNNIMSTHHALAAACDMLDLGGQFPDGITT